MLPVGLLVTLAGYTFVYFGVASIQGPGVGLVDLIVPGRYKGHKASPRTLAQGGGLVPHGHLYGPADKLAPQPGLIQ